MSGTLSKTIQTIVHIGMEWIYHLQGFASVAHRRLCHFTALASVRFCLCGFLLFRWRIFHSQATGRTPSRTMGTVLDLVRHCLRLTLSLVLLYVATVFGLTGEKLAASSCFLPFNRELRAGR